MNTITIKIAAEDYAGMVIGNDGQYDIIDFCKYCEGFSCETGCEIENYQVISKTETFTDCFGSVFETMGYDLECRFIENKFNKEVA